MSPEVTALQSQVQTTKNRLRAAIHSKIAGNAIEALRRDYKLVRNKKNQLVKIERNSQQAEKLYNGIQSNANVWDIIKKFLPDPHYTSPMSALMIKGKSGIDLANHMATFFLDRAHLVTDQEAEECSNFIPYPNGDWETEIDIDDSILYDVKELFKGKKKPTLAAGPNTISHRHISDLMPVLEALLISGWRNFLILPEITLGF